MLSHQRHLVSADPAWGNPKGGEPIGPEESERWFCVYTQPKREFVALKNLEAQSYCCFLPAFLKTVRHARRTRKARIALFPRYLFVQIDVAEQAWTPIRSTVGVTDLVLRNDRPQPVPDGIVTTLRAAVNVDGHVDFRDEIEVGQNVRLLSGPFFNLVGRLQHMDDRGRAKVLLDILGGQRLVHAEKTALLRVAA